MRHKSALHEAYEQYLEGKLTLLELFEMADEVLERFYGPKPPLGWCVPGDGVER